MMASDQFQRSGAIIGGVTQSQVSKILVQFSKAVNKILRPDVLHLPTEERMKKMKRCYTINTICQDLHLGLMVC